MNNFDYVKNLGLQFNGALVKRAQTNLIVLHHTEGGDAETVEGIHAFHKKLGHKGIDYNICVLKDGTVVWGRGLEYEGGHTNNRYPSTKGVNARSVGIVALGNMNINQMPQAQLDAIKRITRDVAQRYEITDIKSHKEIAGAGYTDCPGKLFQTNEIREYALGQPVVPEPMPQPDPTPVLNRLLKKTNPMMRGDDVRQVQTRLLRHLVDVGGVDGIYGAKTERGVRAFQQARKSDGRDIGSVDGIVGQKTWAILWEG